MQPCYPLSIVGIIIFQQGETYLRQRVLGDTIMIEADNKTIITDIHYRRDQAQDDENDQVPDFASDIVDSCPSDNLDIYILTHPDKDHLGGWSEIFHFGDPNDHDDGE